MSRSSSTTSLLYIIKGPKGKTFKTLRSLERAIEKQGGEPHWDGSGDSKLRIVWPAGEVSYETESASDRIEIEQQLGWDLEPETGQSVAKGGKDDIPEDRDPTEEGGPAAAAGEHEPQAR